jgi:hypothetical protein
MKEQYYIMAAKVHTILLNPSYLAAEFLIRRLARQKA